MKNFRTNLLYILFYGLSVSTLYAATTSFAGASSPKPKVTTPNIQALHIRSANIQAEKKNTTKYSSNVEISQGTLTIHADTAIMQNKTSKMFICGNPAKFIDLISATRQIYASAKTMQFDSQANKIILTDNASITDNGKKATSRQIAYDLVNHSYTIK